MTAKLGALTNKHEQSHTHTQWGMYESLGEDVQSQELLCRGILQLNPLTSPGAWQLL